jgi:hypothetical protein
MNADLESLIRLQRAESELRRNEAERGEIPRQRGEQEARLAEERSRVEAVRSALEACQKTRRQHETELQDLEARRSKYKGQLMEVKTNKEYTAMLHEIETVEREIRAREDQILADMERAEGLAADLKREEERYKAAEEAGRRESRKLDERSRALEEEAGRLAAQREQMASRIPERLLDLFQRVARLRGVAVAEARDGMCQLCHVRLRPQMFVDVKRNEDVLQCPACSRILYFEPAAPAASPEP